MANEVVARRLKGHFSRLTHQMQAFRRSSASSAAPHVLSGLSLALPPRVHTPYYYDTVGNVSTSHFRPSFDPRSPSRIAKRESTLELRPRYPLLGGWTYNFTIGYVAPIADHLKWQASTGQYILAVPFLTPVKEIPADHVELSIALPEGAT